MNVKPDMTKLFFLLLYIFSNFYVLIFSLNTGVLMGDVKGNMVQNELDLYLAFGLIASSYVFFGVLLYGAMKLLFSKHYFELDFKETKNRFDQLFLFVQVLYFAFIVTYGLKAGINTDVSNPLKYLWIILPMDFLFYIYYVSAEKGKLKNVNLLLFIVNCLYRGFAGFFFVLIFIYLNNLVANRKFNFRYLIPVIILLFLYPLIHALKGASRISSEELSFVEAFTQILGQVNFSTYISLISETVEKLVARLQIVSVSTEALGISDELYDALYSGVVTMPWLEGIHGAILAKMGIINETYNLGTFITSTSIFSSGRPLGSWNTNYGIFTLLFISPGIFVITMCFLILLCIISFQFANIIDKGKRQRSLLWMMMIFLLVPPWISTFISFVLAQFIYIIVAILMGGALKRVN